ANVDYGVDILPSARILSDGRVRILGEKIAQSADGGGCGGWIARSGKGEDAKAAVGFHDVAEMNRLGVGETDDRRRMKAGSSNESFSQMLVTALAGQDRRTVVRRGSRRVAPVPDKIALRLGRVGAFSMR